MYIALPVRQECKNKNFYGAIIGCKRPKIVTYRFYSSHRNTYLFMFPFNGVNMCIMYHAYQGLQNFFTYYDKLHTRSRRQQCVCCTQSFIQKYPQGKISNSLYAWIILTLPCHGFQYLQYSMHKWFKIS